MARYTGPDCKRCRREKTKLFLKGSKCDRPKCPIEIRPTRPGEHGRGRTKESEYLLSCGRSRSARASTASSRSSSAATTRRRARKPGKTGENLLQILESPPRQRGLPRRLRQVPRHARQLVRHGHFLVNGHKVDIPSYRVAEHDIVEVREKSLELTPFVVARAEAGERTVPAWLEVIPAGCGSSCTSCRRARYRHPGPGAADRRALLEVVSSIGAVRSTRRRRRASHSSRASNSGRPTTGGITRAHRSAPHPDRRGRRRVPVAVRHRAARARLRLHARQLAAPHPALLDPGRGRHQHPDRRRAARVHHRRRASRKTSPTSSSTSRSWSSPPSTTSRS